VVRIDTSATATLGILLDGAPAHTGRTSTRQPARRRDALVVEDLEAGTATCRSRRRSTPAAAQATTCLITADGADRIDGARARTSSSAAGRQTSSVAGDGDDLVFSGLGGDAVDGGEQRP